MSCVCSPTPNKCWNSNLQYLRKWSYFEIGHWQIYLVIWCHTGVEWASKPAWLVSVQEDGPKKTQSHKETACGDGSRDWSEVSASEGLLALIWNYERGMGQSPQSPQEKFACQHLDFRLLPPPCKKTKFRCVTLVVLFYCGLGKWIQAGFSAGLWLHFKGNVIFSYSFPSWV
jgi:hypothetical protein